ncbi:hypothetical protein DUNSADRAFT_4487 [Dunaliella salina]|uniref:Encoded protein n=1 Tax=Dunaliella salina TaxID=3046 RepID=A0ABQ7GRZ6_DUNSA|nr:hypothetical protein DUNSADRAFT_4487 [Dunaliella salina]|eukprot:KAF5837383.1 hypothetical protein DUNSADRAFT_4487 [Dunaliella salina]
MLLLCRCSDGKSARGGWACGRTGVASDVDSDAEQELEGSSASPELPQVNGDGSMGAVEQGGRAAVHALVGSKGEEAGAQGRDRHRGRTGNGTLAPRKAGKIALPRSLYERLTPRSDAAVLERVQQEVRRAAAETGFRQLNSLYPGVEQALAREQAAAGPGLIRDEEGDARTGPVEGVAVGMRGCAELPVEGVLEEQPLVSVKKQGNAREVAERHTHASNTKDVVAPQPRVVYTVWDLALQRLLRQVR